jgi:hypothetical protein
MFIRTTILNKNNERGPIKRTIHKRSWMPKVLVEVTLIEKEYIFKAQVSLIVKLWNIDTSMIRCVACPTRIRVWYSYDTRMTLIQTCRRGVKKTIFPLLRHFLNRCPTPIRHSYKRVGVSVQILFYLFASIFLRHIYND